MDNREAKFILSAYRPGGQDANDPRFSEALQQVRRNPILERWFRESIAFDALITEKLRAAAVPSDLRESILAGVKVTRRESIRGRRNRLRKLAIAAAVVLSATLGVLIWRTTQPVHLADWQSGALDVISSLVSKQSSFDAESANAGELLAWLRTNHVPSAQKLPDNLDKLTSLGCKTLLWHGKPISVICFKRPDGGLIHLVMTNVSATSDRAIKPEAKVIQQGHWATATWREGDMTYMLALEGSRDGLRSYLL